MAMPVPRAYADVNAVIGGYLRDLAFAQSSKQKMFGYKRAAAAILALDVPLTDLLGLDRALPKIPGIGPGSSRIIREIDVVLAAPHSRLRRTEDQTDRLVTAIAHPSVRILAHPRGRITGSRAGGVADWDAVFAPAARRGVAIEIDGDPARQDLDYTLASRALAAGCLFALDSDAHTVGQLAYAETALAHARLAAIPADRVINCWPLERLPVWLADSTSAS